MNKGGPTAKPIFELIGKEFDLDLQDFFYTRLDHVRIRPEDSTEYSQTRARFNAILKNVETSLPSFKDELEEVDEGRVIMEVCVRDLFYRHGFNDGIKFLLNALMS